MFCLRVTYLTGRVYAARFEQGDGKRSVEWPPHPGRLFEALVAAWGETGENASQQQVLEWLESLEPPRLLYSEGSQRHNVTVFVPVNDSNDQFHRTKGTFFQPVNEMTSLRRDRKARRFPSLSLADPNVLFVWEESLPDKHGAPLRELLRHVTSLGHSACLVGVDRVEPPYDTEASCVPIRVGPSACGFRDLVAWLHCVSNSRCSRSILSRQTVRAQAPLCSIA